MGIDKTMALGVGFCLLIGATGQHTRLLQDDPEEPQRVAPMIGITNIRLVRIWWFLNTPSKPINLLVCCHGRNETEESILPPGSIWLAPHDNRGRPPDNANDVSASSDDGQSPDGHRLV